MGGKVGLGELGGEGELAGGLEGDGNRFLILITSILLPSKCTYYSNYLFGKCVGRV